MSRTDTWMTPRLLASSREAWSQRLPSADGMSLPLGFYCCLMVGSNKMSSWQYFTPAHFRSRKPFSLPDAQEAPLQVPLSVSLSAVSSPLIVLGTGNLLPVNLGLRRPGRVNICVSPEYLLDDMFGLKYWRISEQLMQKGHSNPVSEGSAPLWVWGQQRWRIAVQVQTEGAGKTICVPTLFPVPTSTSVSQYRYSVSSSLATVPLKMLSFYSTLQYLWTGADREGDIWQF